MTRLRPSDNKLVTTNGISPFTAVLLLAINSASFRWPGLVLMLV